MTNEAPKTPPSLVERASRAVSRFLDELLTPHADAPPPRRQGTRRRDRGFGNL
ncbi:MAG: hypothetical protein V4449_02620 [Patescibacteria group bacterium]